MRKIMRGKGKVTVIFILCSVLYYVVDKMPGSSLWVIILQNIIGILLLVLGCIILAWPYKKESKGKDK